MAPMLRERFANGAESSRTGSMGRGDQIFSGLSGARARRIATETAVLIVMGLFAGAIGPFGTAFSLHEPIRSAYWVLCIVGGGVIGVAVDETAGAAVGGFWRRLAVTCLVMTLPVALLVLLVGRLLVGSAFQPFNYITFLEFLFQVWVICVPVMALRALAWRRAPARVETRVIVAPPLPEAEAAFRQRLSAKRRAARLIAVEAEDHYLRVHTDAGDELVTAKFADALAELAGAHGFQTHRSWWVAADAIETVAWRRGAGEARLAGDLVAPVSRTHAPSLRHAGWL
jgi:hypothetical protein